MKRNEIENWLSLSDAADHVGVHFSTLRRWADAGKVPCIRTPGGRRRFRRSELNTFLISLRQGPNPKAGALEQLGRRVSIQRAGAMGVRDEPWYSRLDERQLHAMRAEGQQLMAMLMQYASRTSGGEAFLEEGERLAGHYGEVCFKVGLSLVETVRAFILVRRSITDSVYEAGALAGPPDADTLRLYDRTNHFLDTMLLTVLEAYDRARPDVLTDGPQQS